MDRGSESHDAKNTSIMPYTERLKIYYQSIVCPDLVLKDNYKTIFQVPSIKSITLNASSRAFVQEKKNVLPTVVALELMTNQKSTLTRAKKSNASFKLREEQLVGCQITLRKQQLYRFLNVYLSVVLPRFRDFNGIPEGTITPRGHFSMGFTYVLLFPQLENHFELFQNFKGFHINFSQMNSSKKKTLILYSGFQLPHEVHGHKK